MKISWFKIYDYSKAQSDKNTTNRGEVLSDSSLDRR